MTTLFLKLFTEELIKNSLPEKKDIIEEQIEKLERGEVKETTTPSSLIPSMIIKERTLPQQKIEKKKEKKRKALPLQKVQPPQKIKPKAIEISSITKKKPLTKEVQQIQPPQPKISTPKVEPPKFIVKPEFTQPAQIDLGKLNFFLQDPNLTSIECPGPNKFLIVKSFGVARPTKITLTNEEINNIIKKFSEETRIPLIGNIFKAALGNLTITAVISEVAGSRFIITKHPIVNPKANFPEFPVREDIHKPLRHL